MEIPEGYILIPKTEYEQLQKKVESLTVNVKELEATLQKNSKNFILSKDKFSFAQMTSNKDGKTSGSGTIGILICTVGTMCFILGCIDKMWINKDIEIIIQSIIFTGIGAGLLGLRKWKSESNKY